MNVHTRRVHPHALKAAGLLILCAGGCVQGPQWQKADANTPTPAAPATDASASVVPEAGASENSPKNPPSESLRYATPNVTRVTFAEEGADFDPNVSRDGASIVFASTQHRSTADIYIKRAASRVVTRLTSDPSDDVMPALSPDGSRIAFASSRSGNWDIFVMSSSGGKAVQVTSEGTDELHPTWSPDGSKLCYCRLGETSGRWELWVTDVGVESSPHFIGYGMFPKWSPIPGTGEAGSDRILFQLGRERGRRTFGIWTIDYKDGVSGNTSEIISSSDSAVVNPTWSPDARWIAYAEIPLSEQEKAAEASREGWSRGRQAGNSARRSGNQLPDNASLWIIGADGTGKVAVAAGGACLMPDWGFANRLYFVSNRGGPENLWSLDIAQAMLAATGDVNVSIPIVSGVQETSAGESR